MMMDIEKRTDFTSLLQQSRQLAKQTGEYVIERNVAQIEDTTRHLQENLSRAVKDVSKDKGRFLLATKGFDLDRLSRNLKGINLKMAIESTELALSETDLEGFLNLEHDKLIITAIQDAKKEALNQFRHNSIAKLSNDWEGSKAELLEALGFTSALMGKDRLKSTPATPSKPMDFTTTFPPTSQNLALSKMVVYGKCIEELNRMRREKRPFWFAHTFQQAVQTVDDTQLRRKEVVDCWDLLGRIVGESEQGKENSLSEAVYERIYHEDPKVLSRKFLTGAKQFLEKQYGRVMQVVVDRHARTAELGGDPGMHSLARAYARAVISNRSASYGQIEDSGVWADIYYALRAGDLEAARRLAKDLGSPSLQDFVILLKTYKDNGHLNDMQQSECRRIINSARDPFKQTVYMLLACYTPSGSFPSPIATTQDWIWFHLALILQEVNSDTFINALRRLQQLVCKFGPDHFNAKKHPLLYFQVVLSTLQFEKAVEYLWSQGDYALEAVHFAAGLYFYGLLCTPSSDLPRSANSIYTDGTGGRGAVDLPRMLWHYALAVVEQRHDLGLALNYIHLMRNVELEDIMVRDFVLSTREVDTLLGAEGKEGLVQRVLGDGPRIQRLREIVATACEERAELPVAIKLYHEAGDYGKVLSLLNGALGTLVSSTGPDRQAVIALALDVNTRYGSIRGVPTKLTETLHILLHLAHFFDLSNANRVTEALQRLDGIGILPFDPTMVPEKVELFSRLDETVKRNVGDTILTAMSNLYKLYSTLAPSATQLFSSDPARLHEMDTIKISARALATFTGRIQYRLPSDVTSRLLRFEVLMN